MCLRKGYIILIVSNTFGAVITNLLCICSFPAVTLFAAERSGIQSRDYGLSWTCLYMLLLLLLFYDRCPSNSNIILALP